MGFPLFLASCVVPLFVFVKDIEVCAVLVVTGCGLLVILATYRLAMALGLRVTGALFSVGLIVFASPFIGYAHSLFAEVPTALFVSLAVLQAREQRWLSAGLAAGVSASLKPMFGLVGVGLLGQQLLRRDGRAALWLGAGWLAVLGVFGAFQYWHTGRALAPGHQALCWNTSPGAMLRTLIDSRYGLLVFCPWAVIGLASVTFFCAKRGDPQRHAPALVVLPHLLFLMVFAHLGATCFGPRYWVPLLPVLAVATVAGVEDALTRRPRSRPIVAGIALLLVAWSALAALPAILTFPSAADGGADVWDQPAWLILTWL